MLGVASELFAADGYSATSIATIATAADVRGASIYHAFGSKEGLLAAVVEQAADDFFATLPDPSSHSGGLWGAIGEVANIFALQPEFLRLMLLLALERRQGDPEILRTAIDIRRRARAWVCDGLAEPLAHLPPDVRDEVASDMSHLVVMLLDGVFVARQIDASMEEIRPRFDVLVLASRAALPDVIHRVTTQRENSAT